MSRSTPPRYPSQTRAVLKYEKIIEATGAVIEDLGYPKISASDVCKRTGHSIGTFYAYFSDVHHVVDIVQTRHVDIFVQAYEMALDANADTTDSLADMLALILPAMAKTSWEPGWSKLPFRTTVAAQAISPLVARVCPQVEDDEREMLLRMAVSTTAAIVRLVRVYPDMREGMFEVQTATLRGLAG